MKQHLHMDGNILLNEAFNQAMKLEAMKAAARPPTRLWEVAWAPVGT
jgi:hypothetical protein